MNTVVIGKNEYRDKVTTLRISEVDRLRHMYTVGKTGVGKSSLYLQMALQDICRFRGVCFIDPHGDAVDWLLKNIPKARIEDVVVFRPSDSDFPLGLNLIEAKSDSEKSFLVGELISIFYKLFDPNKTGIIGPQFEHWLRNAALTIMADPDGGTILEIPKLFSDKQFEARKLKFVKDPLVQEFWKGQMSKTSDFHRSEMLNYFSSKFGHFLNDPLCRNIVGQEQSTINFDEILSSEKILLVDLSKGKLGELASQFLGLIILAKLQYSVLKRADVSESKRHPFFLYVDEFQNFATETFLSMLSESRKYGLALHLANQYISQVPQEIQNAVLGNVGTILSFQVGIDDAEILARQFEPFKKEDLLNLPKRNFYLKLMIDGTTSQPFSGRVEEFDELFKQLEIQKKFPPSGTELVEAASRLQYGTPKALVEGLIKKRLNLVI